MGFGNFLRGLAAQVNPFDNGKTYGSYNPPRKRRPDDGTGNAPSTISVGNANPTQRILVDNSMPEPQRPTNIFETLNKNLMLGQNKPGVVPVFKNANVQATPPPAPGTVVQPTTPHVSVTTAQPGTQITVPKVAPQLPQVTNYEAKYATEAPKQSFWNKIRDVLDANTEADQYRRGLAVNKNTPGHMPGKVEMIQNRDPGALKMAGKTIVGSLVNIPEVALAAARAGTGIVQGVGNLPHDVTALSAGTTEQIAKHFNNPVTRQVNRGYQDLNTGVKTATHYVVNDSLDPLNRRLDETAKMYERNVPGATGGASAYRATQVPINILAALLTRGSSSAGNAGAAGEGAEAASNASRIARARAAISEFLNKPIAGSEDGAVSKTAQSIISKGRPLVEALNTPIKSTKQGINVVRDILSNRGVQTAERGAVDAGEIGNLLNETQLQDLTTTQVPVATGIDVTQPVTEPVNIPVTNANTPKPLIQEVAGDAKNATTNAQAAQNVINARRVEAARKADKGLPDRSVDGITPRSGDRPFALNPESAANTQDQIVKDYAETLRNMGEGNGTQLVPDGEGGYIRTSNNVRTGESAGKKMTKADWLEEARNQLESGKADSSVQGPYNDAKNPEVQSLLNKGEQAPVEPGRPITVKQATGIPVRDETVVPTDLPEKPGTVRVTQVTAPSNAKSEAAAVQEAATAPVKDVPSPDVPATATTKGAASETLPRPNESDESFLKRVAEDMQTNIQRAVDSLKITKKMTKSERAQRAAAGQKAYEEAKAAGKSIAEQEAARKAAYSGGFDRMDYKGTPVHSEDEQRLRDMVDAHYKDMPYQAGNVRGAFGKLFHSGEPGYYSDTHIIPSDIKNIRKFLNESVPNPDGNGGLGDFAEAAIKDLANQEKGPGFIANAIGLQRALRFTADISATGRQALAGAISHPVEFAKAAAKSFEVMFSHDKYQKYVSEMANNKEANYINDRLGAYLSVLNDDISKADDIYRNSGWAHKIPVVNKVVAASERQYNTLLSEMRYQGGKRFIDAAGGIGNLEKAASDSGDAEGFLKAIGTVTNVNTGRGFGKALDTGASKILSDVLVSPRGLAAKIQRFNPKYYYDLAKTNPAAAKEAVRSLVLQTGVTVSALAAASHAGMYEDGQIKVGNTRYDITGGAANMIRTAVRVAQFVSGDRKTTQNQSGRDEVINWATNQLSPFIASSLNAIGIHKDQKTGSWVDRFGNDVTLGQTALDNLTPVNASQVNSDLQLGTSPTQTAVNAGLNTVGFGVNTYQSAADKKAAAAGTSNSISPGGVKAGTTDFASFQAQAPKEGFTLQKLDDGSYAYSINGETHQTSDLKSAQQAIAKQGFTESGENSKIVKDKYYYKDENGDTKVMPLYQHEFNVADSQNQLDMYVAKEDEDYAGWMDAANRQLEALTTLRDKYNKDSQEDKVDDTQKKIEALLHDMNKYKGYGGFTKGSRDKALDTSFGTLKAGQFAPQVQQYQTIDTKAGVIPHISVVRPNIVHKITSG